MMYGTEYELLVQHCITRTSPKYHTYYYHPPSRLVSNFILYYQPNQNNCNLLPGIHVMSQPTQGQGHLVVINKPLSLSLMVSAGPATSLASTQLQRVLTGVLVSGTNLVFDTLHLLAAAAARHPSLQS